MHGNWSNCPKRRPHLGNLPLLGKIIFCGFGRGKLPRGHISLTQRASILRSRPTPRQQVRSRAARRRGEGPVLPPERRHPRRSGGAMTIAIAPGGPGSRPTWTSSAKDMVTTALGTSRVWVTLGYGILNEVYWPATGLPQIR